MVVRNIEQQEVGASKRARGGVHTVEVGNSRVRNAKKAH